MKREILFRGKKTWDGKWVYGLPVYTYNMNGNRDKSIHAVIQQGNSLHDMINPFSLGEYVNRHDNSTDNKKVFTGDIVKSDDSLYVVIFNEARSMFVGQHIDEYSWRKKGNYCTLGQLEPLEIVGNVIDNPELLTEE